MSDKKSGFTCWSNDQRINEDGQCGVIYGRLFETEGAARAFYHYPVNCTRGDVIVRVTAESLGKVGSSFEHPSRN